MSLRDRIWPLGERAFWARVCPLLWSGMAFWAVLYWPRWRVSLGYAIAAVVLFGIGAWAQRRAPGEQQQDTEKGAGPGDREP